MTKFASDVPLAGLTTLRVGGPARLLAGAARPSEIYGCIELARQKKLPFIVLGGGTNVVVSDAGFPGMVIQVEDDVCDIGDGGQIVRVEVGAGLEWDRFVGRMVEANLAGIECMSGIPGRAGGVPIQNVGAYGQEVAQTIDQVTVLDTCSGKVMQLRDADCGFGHRTSHFKTKWKNRYVVLRIAFRLRRCGYGTIAYADLEQQIFGRGGGDKPTLQEIRGAVIEIRRQKSMVIDEADENRRSVGSFFVNPVIDRPALEQAQHRARELAPGTVMPVFETEPGRAKLSAAWLIEHAGFPRGYSRGRVGLSTRHALAIVNKGDASAAEIVAFAARVRRGVFDRFGIWLEPEAVFIGFNRPVDELLRG